MTRTDFNNLVLSISGRLYSHAYRILRNQEGSEDAVQEVFVKLWKMNDRLGEYNSVEALAITMVKNFCIDQLRKQKYSETIDIDTFSLSVNSELSPHDKLERAETALMIDNIINDLPEIYKDIVHYRDIEDLSYEEIAKKTGQNINTIRVNISRARKIIREKYNKYFNEYRGNKTTA
jgi:RNA polymerase sigma-70 factor (ECF subfamily)